MSSPRPEATVSTRLAVALATPFALLVAVGVVLTYRIVRMQHLAEDVAKGDEIIGKVYEFQAKAVDQETGLRGFLLTSDREFLEPYERSHPEAALRVLLALVSNDPEESSRVEELLRRYQSWIQTSRPATLPDASLAQYRTAAAMKDRKLRMDAVRETVGAILSLERGTHTARLEASTSTYRTNLFALVPLLLALGGVLSLIARRQIRGVADSYGAALESEQTLRNAAEDENRLRKEQMRVTTAIAGDPSIDDVARRALEVLSESTDAVMGALYVSEPGGFRRRAAVALDPSSPAWLGEGEGLVGKAARGSSPLEVKEVPPSYARIRSGTGEDRPRTLLLAPSRVDDTTYGVVELAYFGDAPAQSRELLARTSETLGVALKSVAQRLRVRELLEEAQRQAEELETQQEELRVSNEELQAQSDALRTAQAQLEERKEELETINASLLAQRNALEATQAALEDKASELERANRYKSEFLANMSHELRTPLNSSLILAKLLADNPDANLTQDQVKFAETIYSAGNDLLVLINDILDLSKIESGKLDVHAESVTVERLLEPLVRTMDPVARERRLSFEVRVEDGSALIETDPQRAHQILLNLLSNAFKFTDSGGVIVDAKTAGDNLLLSVTDTGIGIAPHQHDVVFDAFRQADGTTNRKYGGTGLGLSISRDLARLLGGDLTVDSDVGRGSTFTLSLPTRYSGPRPAEPTRSERRTAARALLGASARSTPETEKTPARKGEPRVEGRRLLLVVEDDVAFADIVVNLGQELEFDTVVAHGADEAVRLANEHVPSAVILDLKLPDHPGLSVLDRLKRNPKTRHVPVHVVSMDNDAQTSLAMGAIGHVRKPITRDDLLVVLKKLRDPFTRVRRVLVVEDDAIQRDAIVRLLEAPDLEVIPVATVADALARLGEGTFDCIVTDLTLPDASGYDLLERIATDEAFSFPPVVVYTGRSLTRDEEQRLRRYSSSIIVKGARSPERLLDEITLFLHQVEEELPPDRQRMLRQARNRDAAFDGKTVLLAEDDVRNIFALTSVLEPRGVLLLVARNGKEAISLLDQNPDTDLVLMDIMMPEMDGIRAMEEIRRGTGRTARVPIIALTAKAMRDDQERCMRAGANDYVPKPLDVEVLLSLMRVWMPK